MCRRISAVFTVVLNVQNTYVMMFTLYIFLRKFRNLLLCTTPKSVTKIGGLSTLVSSNFSCLYGRVIPQRGVPLVECSHYLVLSPKGEFLRTPRGVPLFGNAFSCLFRKSIFSPPTTHPKTPYLLGGWLVGWVGVLPFGSLDHVRTIFFKFLVL